MVTVAAGTCYNTPRMKFAVDIRGAIRIGLASARANVMPMVVLWAMAGALVAGYYFVPGIERGLEPVRQWQTDCGWVAAFLNRFMFCGILPGVFMLTMKTLSVPRPGLAIAAQTLWSGICGIVSGWMFELHALWFGTGGGFRDALCQDGDAAICVDAVLFRTGRCAGLFLDRPGFLTRTVSTGMVVWILGGNVLAESLCQLGGLVPLLNARAYVPDGIADPADGIRQRLLLPRSSLDWAWETLIHPRTFCFRQSDIDMCIRS